MADDLKNRGAQDRSGVNIRYEIGYWTEKWDVSKKQLTEAVQKAGLAAEAVGGQLGRTP